MDIEALRRSWKHEHNRYTADGTLVSAGVTALTLSPNDLPTAWRTRADSLEAYAPEVARAFRETADDLELAQREAGNELLSLEEAARRSNYSAEHLGRLVRDEKISNSGRPGAPRIRAADLPRRAPRVADHKKSAYDPATDARNLKSRRKGGRDVSSAD